MEITLSNDFSKKQTNIKTEYSLKLPEKNEKCLQISSPVKKILHLHLIDDCCNCTYTVTAG